MRGSYWTTHPPVFPALLVVLAPLRVRGRGPLPDVELRPHPLPEALAPQAFLRPLQDFPLAELALPCRGDVVPCDMPLVLRVFLQPLADGVVHGQLLPAKSGLLPARFNCVAAVGLAVEVTVNSRLAWRINVATGALLRELRDDLLGRGIAFHPIHSRQIADGEVRHRGAQPLARNVQSGWREAGCGTTDNTGRTHGGHDSSDNGLRLNERHPQSPPTRPHPNPPHPW